MVSQFVVLFLIPLELLFLSGLEAAINVLGPRRSVVRSLDDEERFAMPDVDGVREAREAFAKGEVIDGVEDVCLARTILTDEAVDARRHGEVRRADVSEVYYA